MAEFSIIAQYFQSLTSQSVALGIGDDAAIITPPPEQQLVCCVDTLIAGRHFPFDTSAHAIGWKCLSVNLSDLAAMGAKPHCLLLALSLPDQDDAWLSEFSRGLHDCCQAYHVELIGGDTTKSSTLSITVTAFGWIKSNQAILRSGAQVGDLVAVSGEIGSAAYALLHPDSVLQNTLDYPKPQLALGQALSGYASSMIDISDGLAQDLNHILTASQVAAHINLDAIPIASPLLDADFDTRMQWVLAGGDDYQLCFTLSEQKLAAFKDKFDFPIYVIGQIVSGEGCQYYDKGHAFSPVKLGYQHFG